MTQISRLFSRSISPAVQSSIRQLFQVSSSLPQSTTTHTPKYDHCRPSITAAPPSLRRQQPLKVPSAVITPQEPFTIYSRNNRQMSTSTTTPFYGSPLPPSRNYNDDDEKQTTSLYIPSTSLTLPQRLTIAINSATSVLSNPERGDALAALGEVTGHVALTQMYDRMMTDRTGQRILLDKPVVTSRRHDIDELWETTSEGSFGRAYASFMKSHGFDPDERTGVRFIEDEELAYVMLRYRQCHDFWHVLCDLPPTVPGELALKWLELIQTGLPVAALSVTAGQLRLTADERRVLRERYLPWAVNVGKKATFLMNVYYEEEFDTDLEVLRERLGIERAPQ